MIDHHLTPGIGDRSYGGAHRAARCLQYVDSIDGLLPDLDDDPRRAHIPEPAHSFRSAAG